MPASSWRCKAALAACLLAAAAGHCAAAGTAAFDFTLPSLDGRDFVPAAVPGVRTLVNFWSADCEPCLQELPLLRRFAADHPQWRVLLVSTDPAPQARRAAERLGLNSMPNLRLLRGGSMALLRRAGGIGLPHALALQGGQPCVVHRGRLSEQALGEWPQRCERAGGTSAPSP